MSDYYEELRLAVSFKVGKVLSKFFLKMSDYYVEELARILVAGQHRWELINGKLKIIK
jgi:hypothetical protein